MPNKESGFNYFVLLLIVLSLPALACGPFFGGDEVDEAVGAVEEAADEEAAAIGEAAENIAGTVATTVAATEAASAPADESVGEEESTDADQETTDESDSGASSSEAPPEAGEEATPAPSDSSSSSAPADEEALSTIANAFRSGLSVDSVRIAMTNTFLDTDETDTIILEYIRPDRFHMVSNDLELIIIEEKTYIKGEDDSWIESPFGMNEVVEPLLDSFLNEATVDDIVSEMESDAGAYQYLGEESLEGTQTRVYEFSSPSLLSDEPDRITIWIGVDDGRIYRQEVESDDADGRILVILEYAYGEDVVIEAPIP